SPLPAGSAHAFPAPSPLYSGERVGVRGRASKDVLSAVCRAGIARLFNRTAGSARPTRATHCYARPLTPTLSPEYGGEGAERAESTWHGRPAHASAGKTRAGRPCHTQFALFSEHCDRTADAAPRAEKRPTNGAAKRVVMLLALLSFLLTAKAFAADPYYLIDNCSAQMPSVPGVNFTVDSEAPKVGLGAMKVDYNFVAGQRVIDVV